MRKFLLFVGVLLWSCATLAGISSHASSFINTGKNVPKPGKVPGLYADCPPATPMSGTYTIGASASDYTTFTRAVSDLASRGVNGPVKFRVRAGKYNEQIVIPAVSGAGSVNTITFESYDQDSNSAELFYSPGSTSANYVVKLTNAEYITFRKLKLRAANSTFGYVVCLSGNANYNTFTGNVISSVTNTSSYTTAGFYSPYCQGSHNLFENNYITGGYYGIRLEGGYNICQAGNIIKNNTILNFMSCGIFLNYQNFLVLMQNRIENSAGISADLTGISLNDCLDSCMIMGNRISLNNLSRNTGLLFYNLNSLSPRFLSVAANNFIRVSGSNASPNYGMRIEGSKMMYLCHNTIDITCSAGLAGAALYLNRPGEVHILNNIVVNSGGGFALYTSQAAGLLMSDYNDFYSTGQWISSWYGDLCDNLSSLGKKSGMEAHSISVNPFFYSSKDLHVYNPALDSAGCKIPWIGEDIDGDLRNPGCPDIGADEFDVRDADGCVSEWTAPVFPCDGEIQNIVVRLSDFGRMPLRTTTIKWSINGIKSPDFHFNGNILPMHDTALVIGHIQFMKSAIYSYKVWIDSFNGLHDQNPLNDTLVQPDLHTGISGVFTIGNSVSDNFKNISSAVKFLVDNGICGPVIFNIRTGNYTEHVTIPAIPGASALNTVTFRSAKNDSTSVIIGYEAKSGADNYVIQMDRASFIRFEKITIKATGASTYGTVVDFRGTCSNNIFRNNILESKRNAAGTSNVLNFSYDFIFLENNIFENNILFQGKYSVYMGGTGSRFGINNIFRNNSLKAFLYSGFEIRDQNFLVVSGNMIQANATTGMAIHNSGPGCVISGNWIYMTSPSDLSGINMDGPSGKPGAEITVANNMIIFYGSSTSQSVYGIRVTQGVYINIFHNSIRIGFGSSWGGGALYFERPCDHFRIENNILANYSGGYALNITNEAVRNAVDISGNFNDFYSSGSYLATYGGAPVKTLNDLKSISGMEVNSFLKIPSFVSATDLHLATFNAFLVKNNTGVKMDFDGDWRTGDVTAAGADCMPTLKIDAGVHNIVSPQEFECEGAIPLVINIRNFGLSDLDSLFIDYFKNGVLQKTVTWKGKLKTTEMEQVSLGAVTFSHGQGISVKFRTRLPNGKSTDTYSFNDADSLKMTVYAVPVIKKTVNDTVCDGDTARLKVYSDNTGLIEWWDSLSGGKVIQEGPVLATGPLHQSKICYVTLASSTLSGSLATRKNNQVLEMGNMFNIKAISSDIIMDSVEIMTNATIGLHFPVAVFYRPVSYEGFETDSSAWSLFYTDTVISNGNGEFTPAHVNGLRIRKGESCGIYITSTDPYALFYNTEGTSVFRDGNLEMKMGSRTFYPFDSYYISGSTWNGIVYYRYGGICKAPRMPVYAVMQPVASLGIAGNLFLCKGKSITLDPGKGSKMTYAWRYGNDPRIISVNHSITVDSGGLYKLHLTDGKCGNSGSDSVFITISPVPRAGFKVNDTSQCFHDNSFLFSNTSGISSGTMTYTWNMGDSAILNVANPGHGYSYPGRFRVELLAVSDKNCRDSVSRMVRVKTDPQVDLGDDTTLYNGQSLVLDAGPGFDKYVWSTGDTSRRITIDSTENGSFKKYYVTVTREACTGSDTIFITFKTSVAGGGREIKFRIYPNPAHSTLEIEFSGYTGSIKMDLSDAGGKIRKSTLVRLQSDHSDFRLDISDLPAAIYFMRVSGTGFEQIIKIVKY